MAAPAPLLGLVGCGAWGRHILRDLAALGPVAVVARSPASRAHAAAHPTARVVPDLDALVALDPAGVVVATPTTTHAAVLEELLRRLPGVPLFGEKPLTDSLAAARRLAALGGERLFAMDKWRYHPGVQRLAAHARAGTFGPVLGLRTERLAWGSSGRPEGAAWHLLPHDFAIALEVLGTLPPLRWSLVQRDRAGSVTGLTCALGRAPWVECRVSSHHPVRLRRVQLVCERAIVSLDDGYADALTIASGPLDQGDREPERRTEPFAAGLPLAAELRAFADHVRGTGPPPRSGIADTLLLIERIERALADG
ncbi:MAG: Gfo/Idh/MocA family oxidoreductase [Planctomycetes bacterium]|nr:Gfo/Idh/MocA family oxidoreductase [Planctomycetota bacterium]